MGNCNVPLLKDPMPNNLLVAFDPVDHHSQEISRHEQTLRTVKCSCLYACCPPSGMFLPHFCLICLIESTYPSESLLNPQKINPSLLSANIHVLYSYVLLHVFFVLHSVIYGVGHLASL